MKILIPLAVLLFSVKAMSADVTYKITFTGNFTKAQHPNNNFPSNPHFSPVVVASHNAGYSMFQKGFKATKGVKDVAETGSSRQLSRELSDLQSSNIVLEQNKTGGLSGNGSASTTITVNEDCPLISAVTMVAPSPDWIVGVSAFTLYKDGEFIKNVTLPLYAYDAGTDSGSRFTSSDRPLRSPAPIDLLINVSGNAIKNPFGFLKIERL